MSCPSSGGIAPLSPFAWRLRNVSWGELSEFGRDRAAQLVRVEAEMGQLGELPEFGWDPTREPVGTQVQHREFRQLPQFRRDSAAEPVPR